MTRILPVVLLAASALPALAAPAPLIPREVLFGNPTKASPRISADGKTLAYLAPDEKNVLQVWVRPLSGKGEPVKVTDDAKRGIRQYSWTYLPDTLVYSQDTEGDENFHLFAVEVGTGKVRDLTPEKGVRAQVVGTSRKFPNEMLVGMNKRDKRVFDVYRLDLKTGEATLEVKNPGNVVGWSTDNDFKVRIAQVPTATGGTTLMIRDAAGGEFKKLLEWSADDADGGVVGFSKDNKSVLLSTSQGRDLQALVRRDLETGKETVVAEDKQAEFSNAVIDPETHEVEAVAFSREKTRWRILDKSFQADYDALVKGAKGEPVISGTDKARENWVVAYVGDTQPTTFYHYHRPTKKLNKLFVANPKLAGYTLAPMTPVVIPARDGLELVSYLTLPVGVEAKNLPTVLLVHGGPWARDSWGYDAQAQWLANRGYAVLQVNFRGSTGFGKKFLHAGDREWGKKMHDDLLDAVAWAVKKGYTDEKKVGIMGGSYGGYAALAGAAFTPDTFACAVSIVGPSNLVTLLKSIPPYWAPMMKLFDLRVGSLDDPEFLKSRSPLFSADKIKIPMMIAQGANDPRVKQAESEQIVDALRKAGKPVEYLLFKDEGHGFARPENRLKFMAACEAFLAKHLGGRSQPAGKE